LFHPAWWQKFLDQNSLDKIFPKETTKQNKTKQRKEICEEEALEKCTNVCKGKKTHTHTHTHTQLKDQSKVAQLIQLELGC
jgi:excinuclease UvrABC nuclease subunit